MDLGKLARELKPYIQRWVDGVASALRLDDLADVNAPAPADGDALMSVGGVWVNRVMDPTIYTGDLIYRYGMDNTNLAAYSLGARAYASSGSGADNGIDGDDVTYWQAGTGGLGPSDNGQRFMVDLQTAQLVSRYVFDQGNDIDYRIKTYKIQVSDDTVNWTDVTGEITSTDQLQQGTFTAVLKRYIGVYCVEDYYQWIPWRIYRFEIYGSASTNYLARLAKTSHIGWAVGTMPDGSLGYIGEMAPAAHNQAATTITVADAADYFTGTEVEAILAEVGLGWAKLARTNTFTLPQTIAGSTDAVQLTVKGSASQTANLFNWQTSADAALGGINYLGYAGFGTAPAAVNGIKVIYLGTNTNLECAANIQAYLPAANALATYRIFGQYCTVGFARDVSGYANPITELKGQHNITNIANGSAGNVTGIWGGSYIIYASGGSGGATNAYGMSAALTGATGWTGTITNGYGIRIDAATVGASGGAITNLHGLYIANQNVGSTVNNAIVTNAGNVIFNEGGDASTDLRAESDTESNMLFLDSSADKIYLGGTTNGAQVAKGGVITYNGTAKRHLSLRPQLYAGRIGGVAKPTFVTYGANAGYSFPIFSSDDEELFFRESLPGRWDGASDITGYLVCALAGAEDVNDDFAFQLSWANKATDAGVIASATTDVTVPQNVETGRAAQYSIYKLAFTIDWDGPATDAAAGDYFAGRIRRVASGGTEVAGEIILLDFYMSYVVDKIFKA